MNRIRFYAYIFAMMSLIIIDNTLCSDDQPTDTESTEKQKKEKQKEEEISLAVESMRLSNEKIQVEKITAFVAAIRKLCPDMDNMPDGSVQKDTCRKAWLNLNFIFKNGEELSAEKVQKKDEVDMVSLIRKQQLRMLERQSKLDKNMTYAGD